MRGKSRQKAECACRVPRAALYSSTCRGSCEHVIAWQNRQEVSGWRDPVARTAVSSATSCFTSLLGRCLSAVQKLRYAKPSPPRSVLSSFLLLRTTVFARTFPQRPAESKSSGSGQHPRFGMPDVVSLSAEARAGGSPPTPPPPPLRRGAAREAAGGLCGKGVREAARCA